MPVVGRTTTSGPAPRTPEAVSSSAQKATVTIQMRASERNRPERRRRATCAPRAFSRCPLVDTLVTTSTASIAPPLASIGRSGSRQTARGRRSDAGGLEVLEDERAPGLHAIEDRGDVHRRREAAGELLGLA